MTITIIWIGILMFLFPFNQSKYYDQDKVFRVEEISPEINRIKSNEQYETEMYFEAIKETFDLYNRDDKYKDGKVCQSGQTHRDIVQTSYHILKKNFDKNCSYVVGNVVISHIHDEDISFLNSIKEISGYLFLYENTIESISLNNLKIIRGENPMVLKGKKFGLVISENDELMKYVLMPQLQVILNYDILFYKNPGLCYVPRKISWDSLIRDGQQMLILENENRSCSLEEISTREPNCHSSCQWYSGKQYCWSNSSLDCQHINTCQTRNCSSSNNCFKNKVLKSEECCHDQCAGGCSGPSRKHCLACKNYVNNGECIEYCPRQMTHDGLKYQKNPHGKLAFNHICVDKCPVKFFNEYGNCVSNCTLKNTYAVNQTCLPCPNDVCPKVCRFKDIFGDKEHKYLTRQMVNRLENCTVYDGNIVISEFSIEGDPYYEITELDHGIRDIDLKKLQSLTEIYGYLKINVGYTAPWLKALFYFRNLKIIRAETLDSMGKIGLAINNNKHLMILGLQSLNEVRYGNIDIRNNPALCLTKTLTSLSVRHSQKMLISRNGDSKQCKLMKCDKNCNSLYGCWSPMPMFCVKCKNYQLPDTKICVPDCTSESGYFIEIKNETNTEKQCSKCHQECNFVINTCYGPDADQCNYGCKNYTYQNYCVPQCPNQHYSNDEKLCQKCHSKCSEIKNKSTCTGPYGHIGENGCNYCNYGLLNINLSLPIISDSYQIICLNATERCPIGYFMFFVDFRSGDHKFSRLHSILSNNNLIVQILNNWFMMKANHEYPIGSICLPCHPYCSKCLDGSNWNCPSCTYMKLDNKCVQECPTDFFIEATFNDSGLLEKKCIKCHEQCIDGCSGPNEYHCKKCKNVKIFSNSSTNEFFCNSTCGELDQIFHEFEIICGRSWSITKWLVDNYIETSISAIAALLLLIFLIFTISCCRRKKAFHMKLNYLEDFYLTDTETNNAVAPNMATLLLITESQLTKGEIIGSGAFGVVYKGIWQPNLDTIDKSSSFLKRNLSKLSQDSSIKLMVAVKILTDISDPANNRELLEEAKVMASVDHPCCLRILAVCLTAHPKLITQFMPLGCLLEFCQRHRSLINNVSFLVWSKQIACGMEYLESKGIIHCDLAARNVLVQSPRQVKITDFGLAKMLDYSEQQYQFKGGRMPIKWLAIECIKNRIFSSKSDVWSYGVTLWEMFTFGEKPFPNIKAFDVLEHLERGQRLNQPKICSIDAYTILIQCWLLDPDARPSFTELKKTFEMMAANPNRYLLIENTESIEPFYVDWEDDALKYDEFLQFLVSVPQINSDYDSLSSKPLEKDHIKSVRSRYREMRAFKNCFINEIYDEMSQRKDKHMTTNPDYTAIIFDETRPNSNQSGSNWSEYDIFKNKRLSNGTTMTNIISNGYPILKPDLSDDGYLIPRSKLNTNLMCKYSCLPQVEEKPDNIIYSCETIVAKEILINHESSI